MPDYTNQLAEARAESKTAPIAESAKSAILPESQISDVEFIIIGTIALIDDVLDYFGVGLLTFRMLDLCTAAILGFWCTFRLKKFPAARFATAFIIELIPFLGDFSPTWTIFVITTYAKQKGYAPKIKFLSKFIEK